MTAVVAYFTQTSQLELVAVSAHRWVSHSR